MRDREMIRGATADACGCVYAHCVTQAEAPWEMMHRTRVYNSILHLARGSWKH